MNKLESLVKSIRDRQAFAESQRKSKATLKAKGKFKARVEPTVDQLAAAMLEAQMWEPREIVLLCQWQHCACGEEMQNVAGLFVRLRHKTNAAERLSRMAAPHALDLLPKRVEYYHMKVPACPTCMQVQSMVELLMTQRGPKAWHEADGQLPLFHGLL